MIGGMGYGGSGHHGSAGRCPDGLLVGAGGGNQLMSALAGARPRALSTCATAPL